MDLNKIPFKQAKWYTPTKGRAIQLIVIHSMEAPEKGETAENIANYFANTGVKASAHYCIDNNSIVQCLQTKDVAYAAPGANHNGIHLELAGYARQTAKDWQDQYSVSMLKLAASLCGKVLCAKYDIPLVYLPAPKLKVKGSEGFTTHNEVSKAFGRSSHWDPGPHFPIAQFLGWVRDAGG